MDRELLPKKRKLNDSSSSNRNTKLQFQRHVPKFLQQFGAMIKDPNFTKKAAEAADEWREDFKKKGQEELKKEEENEEREAYEDAKKFGTIVAEEDALLSAQRDKLKRKQEKKEERRAQNEKNSKIMKVLGEMGDKDKDNKDKDKDQKKKKKKKKVKNSKKLNNRMLLSFDEEEGE